MINPDTTPDQDLTDLIAWLERIAARLDWHPEFIGGTYAKPFFEKLAQEGTDDVPT